MTKKPYHRPPHAAQGADSADAIHLAKGKALDTWELMESTLIRLFSTLTNAHFLTCNEIFGSIISSSGRIDAIIGAARAFYVNYPEKLREITKFLSDISKLAGLRNDIAHGISLGTEDGVFHGPAFYAVRKFESTYLTPSNAKFWYSDVEINEICDRFETAISSIYQELDEIKKWLQTVNCTSVPPYSGTRSILQLQKSSKPHQS